MLHIAPPLIADIEVLDELVAKMRTVLTGAGELLGLPAAAAVGQR